MHRDRIALAVLIATAGLAGLARAEDEKAIEFTGWSRQAQSVIERFTETLARAKTYSDNAVMRMVTDSPFKMPDRPQAVSFATPNRVHLRTADQEVCCDGKELTVYYKNMQRYKVTPIEKDLAQQVSKAVGGERLGFDAASLLLAKRPAAELAERIVDLELAGKEDIDNVPCVILTGQLKADGWGLAGRTLPITFWLRASDGLLRRAEIDMLDLFKEQMEQAGTGMTVDFEEYKMVYDVREARVNESLPDGEFKLEPPKSAKKVDKIYSRQLLSGDTAQQFERSGEAAPDFELPDTNDRWVSLSSLRGRIVAIYFAQVWDLGGAAEHVRQLSTAQRELRDQGVQIVWIQPRADAQALVDEAPEAARDLTILLDADAAVGVEYFDRQYGWGLVLVDTDGVVQGCYPGPITDKVTKALASDVAKLRKGEKLASAKPMTSDEKQEAADQRASRFGGTSSVEALNEEYVVETWSVLARQGNSWSGPPQAGFTDEGLWVRDLRSVRCVGYDGQVVAELPLPYVATGQYVQDAFAVGRLGRGWSVVYMSTIAGDEVQQGGWRPPKAIALTASDEAGRELWSVEFDITGNQAPQQLVMANVDGRGGDEVLFVLDGALWILDSRGEVLVRKPLSGWATAIFALDRDRDRKAEIYIRTNQKLFRYDYERGR